MADNLFDVFDDVDASEAVELTTNYKIQPKK